MVCDGELSGHGGHDDAEDNAATKEEKQESDQLRHTALGRDSQARPALLAMRRIFQRGEEVVLSSPNHPALSATVELVSGNQEAIAFSLGDSCIGTPGGIVLTHGIACMQDDTGRLVDLYGVEWKVMAKA